MTILFAGGEMGAFVPSDSNVIENTSGIGGGSASYDPDFARGHLRCYGSATYALADLAAATDDLWLHFELDQWNASGTASKTTVIEFLNSSGVAKFRLTSAWSSGTWGMDYHNGSSWVALGSDFTTLGGSLQTLDVHIVCNSASGSANVYLSGTNRLNSGTVDLSSITEIEQLKLYGNNVAIPGYNAFSQVIATEDESTIGWRLKTVPPTSAGATTDWTGTYAEVDEFIYSDADFINTATATQVELFAHSTAIPSGYSIRGIAVTARARRSGGPTKIQLALRSAGTTYFSGDKTLDAGYGAFVHVWDEDPATTAAFTTAAIAALQFGVKAIA